MCKIPCVFNLSGHSCHLLDLGEIWLTSKDTPFPESPPSGLFPPVSCALLSLRMCRCGGSCRWCSQNFSLHDPCSFAHHATRACIAHRWSLSVNSSGGHSVIPWRIWLWVTVNSALLLLSQVLVILVFTEMIVSYSKAETLLCQQKSI